MRGSLSLFADLIDDKTPIPEGERKKGRNPQLNAKRNECLVHRYYFHFKFTDARYSIIIERLSNEFFISQVTIPELLSLNSAMLARLKKEAPAKSYFSKKWPHLSW